MRDLIRLCLPLPLLLVACQADEPASRDRARPTAAEAARFVDNAERELREAFAERDRMDWVNMTYITDDTDWLAARSTERVMALTNRLITEARAFADVEVAPEVRRKLRLLELSPTLPAPADAELRRELATLSTTLSSTYGKGKYQMKGEKEPRDLNGLSRVIAEERDYDRLLEAWQGWHQISVEMRPKYERLVAIANQGAEEIGFKNLSELWRARYDMTPAEFEAEQERLWQQVKPFYDSLHCYVRQKLTAKYGESKVPPGKPIPAHLLGNMWAQEWNNLYPLVAPFPNEPSTDVTKNMVAKKFDPVRMMKIGEAFFTSLGMPALPDTFWQRSMLSKPKDRDVVCHASAWDIGLSGDVRIKMCTEITDEDLATVHHELGHNYYYLLYGQLSPLFQDGANDGFHEGIGDTLVLSMTPGYLKELGLIDAVDASERGALNTLMKRALEKVAFLPFGMLIDKWRWQVFDGRTTAADYNAAWWKLRTEYQGIAPALARSEADFDAGAKYHIPANTPYARYFLADILQFQFHRALCRAAGHAGPLATCSIYGSKPAGEKLVAMMQMGASKPWPEALAALSGETKMDASALTEYFAPLKTWLDEQNQGQSCGW